MDTLIGIEVLALLPVGLPKKKKNKQAKELAIMARVTDFMKSSVDTPKSLKLVREDSKDTESEIDIPNVESPRSNEIGLLLLGTSTMTTERECDIFIYLYLFVLP